MVVKGVHNLNVSITRCADRCTFGRALVTELRRGIFSIRFLLGIMIILAWGVFNAAEAVGTYDNAMFAGVVQLIRFGLEGHQSTGPVLLAIATIPYAFSYLTEKECGFQQQAIERIGVMSYGICKAIAVFLSAFLMGAVALWVFVGVLSVLGIPHTVRYEEVKDTYAVLVTTMGPGWYYAVKAFLVGFVCGQAALFSLMIMSRLPNAYVGFLSPLIGYYTAECILDLLTRIAPGPLWGVVSPARLLFVQPLSDVGFSFLWTVLVLMALSVSFTICFILQMGKEYT